MPVIKSAKKKLRQDKKREIVRAKFKKLLKSTIHKAHKQPSEELIKKAITLADKAAKHNIIHKNKAARIKSTLSKLMVNKPVKKTPEKRASKKKNR